MRLIYSLSANPQVHIIAPDLTQLAEGQELPHVYEGNELCLFLPGSGEWMPSMFIASTIIPWVVDWLRFFEFWLATGEWHGGGIHPGLEN